jgi:hypothetical protein
MKLYKNIMFVSMVFILAIEFFVLFNKKNYHSENNESISKLQVEMGFDECLKKGIVYKETFPGVCTFDNVYFFENEGGSVNYKDLIIIEYPTPGELVTSPLNIRGKARGNWIFEANFPISLDLGLGEIVNSYVQTKGEWMTSEFVDFSATSEFPESDEKVGMLTFYKANASDLDENDDSVSISVRLK